MHFYRLCSVTQRPLPLAVSDEVFINEWRLCREDKARDASTLFGMIKPFLIEWRQNLDDTAPEKNIHYIGLLQLLEAKGYNPVKAIDMWVQRARRLSSIDDELSLIFCEQLRKMKFVPHTDRFELCEWVIAMNFKYRLQTKIQVAVAKGVDAEPQGLTFESTETVEDIHPDYLLWKNTGFSVWQQYMFLLHEYEETALSISKLCHIPRETFYYEEIEIWQRLKQMYSDKEM
jgi:hypothetical protein